MTPCPLCLLGFSEPHTKEDWARLAEPELRERLDAMLNQRYEELLEAYAEKLYNNDNPGGASILWSKLPQHTRQHYLQRADHEIKAEELGY